MKITFDIECTAEEARKFLGLPDVSASQDRLMKEWEDKMKETMETAIAGGDPVAMMKMWNPLGNDAMDSIQKTFMKSMGLPQKDEE